MADLPAPSTPTLTAIYASYEARQGDGFRDHLGASIIGKSCARALWYDFRWVTPSRHSGRLLRLFETGQLEEDRMVRNLRATGATVLEVDPDTGRQFRVEAHGGHFGGSLDGVALGLLEAPKTWHVLEFKTHSARIPTRCISNGLRPIQPWPNACWTRPVGSYSPSIHPCGSARTRLGSNAGSAITTSPATRVAVRL